MGEKKRKLEAKKKLFEKDPDRFVDLEDLIVGSFKAETENGDFIRQVLINPSAKDVLLEASAFCISHDVRQGIEMRRMIREKEANDNKIITKENPGGIITGK